MPSSINQKEPQRSFVPSHLHLGGQRVVPPQPHLRLLHIPLTLYCMGHRGKGFQALLLQFHGALGAFTAILIAVLDLMYQHRSVSPFEAFPRCMFAFLGSLSLHLVGVIAAVMVRGSGTRGRRSLAVAVTLSHLSFISGLFASASILFMLLPASVWSVLMASCSVIILMAAPCNPAGLLYSKLQQYFYPQAVNQGEQAEDAITPDLENNLGLELSSIQGPNQDVMTVNSRLD